ncbi:Hca operon transcriptional activator HcaR [Defluviimonas aquaemixtae]|uniref:Hca operon transcriptional activator HcaR n=1 Tax=Albidovulum aquaemixtae TaxID=1542388 RepID=A0A2R8BK06_9RHOB|nr:LysR family transcriptional regulator [Defluviimonas aquaemixtae]SPH23726.1 Hca operon transcriptional activator HcaR [Defluviimonas aquaemixtae]
MIGNVFTLKQLEALVWVADLGSFRRAAQHLNTTQPNISSRIAGLEDTLGMTLMLRDAGSVRMTEKGKEILQIARKVLRRSEELIEVARRLDLVEDRLRLGVTEMVACTWLHRYLRRLKNSYPGVSVELTVDLSRNLDKAVGSGGLDLAIQTAPFGSAASGVIELGDYPYVWVAEKGIAAGLTGTVRVEDLIPLNILTHARHTQAFVELAEYAEAQALPTTRFVPSSSLSSCLPMALDGLGVALLPRVLVDGEVNAGRLVILDVDWTPSPLRFAARYQAEKVARYVEHSARIAAEIATEFLKDGVH